MTYNPYEYAGLCVGCKHSKAVDYFDDTEGFYCTLNVKMKEGITEPEEWDCKYYGEE